MRHHTLDGALGQLARVAADQLRQLSLRARLDARPGHERGQRLLECLFLYLDGLD